MEWIPVLVVAVLVLIVIVRNIYVVQQSRAYVIELQFVLLIPVLKTFLLSALQLALHTNTSFYYFHLKRILLFRKSISPLHIQYIKSIRFLPSF